MGFFQRLKDGLFKTRSGLTDKVDELVKNTRVIDDDFYDELTDILILADVGVAATTDIMDKLRQRVDEQKIKDADQAKEIFKQILVEEMNIPRPNLRWPMVMFVVGVNGVGKTTTIGKLALRFQEIGRSVMLAAADTFRAAADEQLAIWADRAKVPIIRGQEGGDPASVVYDAVQSAKARKTDLLIVDTAGRLHNKKNLMDELSKMRRIIDR
jgi:fused signal recognition particle receptor